MDDPTSEGHLTDAELFSLAAPAAGEPEPLPRHLSRCQGCSRALREWKASVRALAEEELGPLNRRSPEQWRAAEEATIAAIRKAGRPGRRAHPLRWAAGIAATLLLLALAVPARRPGTTRAAAPTPSADAGLSPADREDDALLRDAAYLAQGGGDSPDIALEDSL